MIKTIYGRAVTVLAGKPLKLWGLSLLSALFTGLAVTLFGIIPGVALALGWLLSVSMTMVFLKGYLGGEVCIADLFGCFKDWPTIKRVLLGMGYMVLLIFLWALIPVVGIVFAVIRAYEYALVPYILVHEPDVSITGACKVSKERTNGFKGRMFLADILWKVLAAAAVLILGVAGSIPYAGWFFALIAVLAALCALLFGKLFSGLVKSAFYVEIQRQTGKGPQFDDSRNNPAGKDDDEDAAGYCPKCGTRRESGAAFCTVCGNAFEAAPEAQTAAPGEETGTEENL